MPVQLIRSGGAVVGFQARWQKRTVYFPVRTYGELGAERRARSALAELVRKTPPRANNRSGVVGLRLFWREHSDGSTPVLYVGASWVCRLTRKQAGAAYSTEANGRIGAVELAIQARERGMGVPMGLTAREAWARLARSAGINEP